MGDETANRIDQGRTAGTDRVLLFVLPLLAFLPPMVHAYTTLKLPLGIHFWLLSGGIAALALLLGSAMAWLGTKAEDRPWQILQAVLLGSVVLLLIDLSTYRFDASLLLAHLPWALGLWACLAATFWLLRRQLPKILFAGALALLLSTVAPQVHLSFLAPAAQAGASGGTQKEAPPFIYIVLDEMIGPEGIPKDIEGGEKAYQAVRQLFDKHGFRLFGSAFSRHSLTVRSIPNTLNYDVDDNSWGMVLRHSNNGVVQSVLFEELALSKPLVVYQTKHINFCSSVPTRCETLQSYDAQGEWVTQLGLGAAETLFTLREALFGSLLARGGIQLLAATLRLDLNKAVPEYFDVHAFPAWFDHFSDDVVRSEGNSNYFAHLLSPHAPYILDASCAPQQGWELPYNLDDEHLSDVELDDARARHYRAYFKQMTCLLGKLDAFLMRLADSPAFSDATIVLHGDHGSRISGGRFAETITERDLVDNHSTLYAIRAPEIEAAYDLRRVSVQQLTVEYFGNVSRPASDGDLSVAIDSIREGHAVVLQMPKTQGETQLTGEVAEW